MKLSIPMIQQLSSQQRYNLQAIWHPKKSDQYVILEEDEDPKLAVYSDNKDHVYMTHKENAYPILTLGQLILIIEDYASYDCLRIMMSDTFSSNELFSSVWEHFKMILDDSGTIDFLDLTVPIMERNLSRWSR